jgi:hypothetical protein
MAVLSKMIEALASLLVRFNELKTICDTRMTA